MSSPTGGANSAPPNSLAVIKGSFCGAGEREGRRKEIRDGRMGENKCMVTALPVVHDEQQDRPSSAE